VKDQSIKVREQYEAARDGKAPLRVPMHTAPKTKGEHRSSKRIEMDNAVADARAAGRVAGQQGLLSLEEGLEGCKSTAERNAFTQAFNGAREQARLMNRAKHLQPPAVPFDAAPAAFPKLIDDTAPIV
jgi:hypothetical protein